MERIVKQNYSYAVDASGVLVNVKQAVRDKKYFCPCCGFEMRPHMGNIRRWHFTHKAEAECSYESYLHKIAKIRIKEAFITSEKFEITYNPKHLCSKDCPFLYDENVLGMSMSHLILRSIMTSAKKNWSVMDLCQI